MRFLTPPPQSVVDNAEAGQVICVAGASKFYIWSRAVQTDETATTECVSAVIAYKRATRTVSSGPSVDLETNSLMHRDGIDHMPTNTAIQERLRRREASSAFEEYLSLFVGQRPTVRPIVDVELYVEFPDVAPF